MTSPITDTPYPYNCIEISLFEQNEYTICGHLVAPYILVIKNCMPPYFSFKKFVTPSKFGTKQIWDPPSEENASLLK